MKYFILTLIAIFTLSCFVTAADTLKANSIDLVKSKRGHWINDVSGNPDVYEKEAASVGTVINQREALGQKIDSAFRKITELENRSDSLESLLKSGITVTNPTAGTPAPTTIVFDSASFATAMPALEKKLDKRYYPRPEANKKFAEVADSTTGKSGQRIETALGKIRREQNTHQKALEGMYSILSGMNHVDSVLDANVQNNTTAINEINIFVKNAQVNLDALNSIVTAEDAVDTDEFNSDELNALSYVKSLLYTTSENSCNKRK